MEHFVKNRKQNSAVGHLVAIDSPHAAHMRPLKSSKSPPLPSLLLPPLPLSTLLRRRGVMKHYRKASSNPLIYGINLSPSLDISETGHAPHVGLEGFFVLAHRGPPCTSLSSRVRVSRTVATLVHGSRIWRRSGDADEGPSKAWLHSQCFGGIQQKPCMHAFGEEANRNGPYARQKVQHPRSLSFLHCDRCSAPSPVVLLASSSSSPANADERSVLYAHLFGSHAKGIRSSTGYQQPPLSILLSFSNSVEPTPRNLSV
ncbi:hypothetical protein MUK42_07962 [Musa troglodytarum]|uniref:Uncharacterized protein n=1 Tax=Musa troglodytarum TaxID=320322 RepID=A0A9E7EX65_9LILI|nr:hypothetical protein MUK42_07962 [Musa troglodytarum]